MLNISYVQTAQSESGTISGVISTTPKPARAAAYAASTSWISHCVHSFAMQTCLRPFRTIRYEIGQISPKF